MIYIFYTTLALIAIVFIATLKAQQAHIRGLKGMYKEEARKSHELNLDMLNLHAEMRAIQDVSNTWANQAHKLNEDLTNAMKQHAHEIEQMRAQIWAAGEYQRKRNEYKKQWRAKRKADAGK
jgi:hypothetical protein